MTGLCQKPNYLCRIPQRAFVDVFSFGKTRGKDLVCVCMCVRAQTCTSYGHICLDFPFNRYRARRLPLSLIVGGVGQWIGPIHCWVPQGCNIDSSCQGNELHMCVFNAWSAFSGLPPRTVCLCFWNSPGLLFGAHISSVQGNAITSLFVSCVCACVRVFNSKSIVAVPMSSIPHCNV